MKRCGYDGVENSNDRITCSVCGSDLFSDGVRRAWENMANEWEKEEDTERLLTYLERRGCPRWRGNQLLDAAKRRGPKKQKESAKHFEAMGNFVLGFAITEGGLWASCGLSWGIASLFGASTSDVFNIVGGVAAGPIAGSFALARKLGRPFFIGWLVGTITGLWSVISTF